MNVLAPVSTIMSTHLITVMEKDRLSKVRDIFKNYKIHHVPVVHDERIVGIISREDLYLFMKGAGHDSTEKTINETLLQNYNTEVIMTRGMAKLEPTDRINVALDIFCQNIFRALPIVENDKLVGIVTPLDILKTLNKETSNPTL